MKRKKIIGSLLIVVVVTEMLSACASSRHVANVSHQEVKDSVRSEQVDSSHIQIAASDSVQKSEQSTMQASSSTIERDSLDEIIREHITETTDAQGNKTTTTDRTIQRKRGSQKQAATDMNADYQRHEIEQMKQSVDRSSLTDKTDVGTHWAVKDTLSDEQEKNTEGIKKESWIDKARKNVFQLFLLFVMGLMLVTIKRKRDDMKRKGNQDGKEKTE